MLDTDTVGDRLYAFSEQVAAHVPPGAACAAGVELGLAMAYAHWETANAVLEALTTYGVRRFDFECEHLHADRAGNVRHRRVEALLAALTAP